MKKIIFLSLFLSIFLTSCGKQDISPTQKFFQTTLVQSWNIASQQYFIWYAEWISESILSSKIGGKIVQIHSPVGTKVKKWDLLVSLDATEANVWYRSSSDIITSLETLKNSTALTFDQQIKAMEEKIKQAQIWVEMAQIWSDGFKVWISNTQNIISQQISTVESQILQAQNWLETSQTQLKNTQNILEQKKSDIYKNSLSSLSSAEVFGNNLFDFWDNFFWITQANKNKNDAFDIFISARNTALKNQAEKNIEAMMNDFKNLKKLPRNSQEEIKMTLDKYYDFFENDIKNTLSLTFEILENSVESTSFSQETIQQYKNTTTNFQTQNQNLILSISGQYMIGLKWSIDSINSFEKEKISTLNLLEKQIISAEKQILVLENTLKQYQAMWEWQLSEISTKDEIQKQQTLLAKQSLTEAQIGHEALKQKKVSQLQQIQTQIKEVQAWLSQAWVNIENAKIYAPFDGIITQKFWEIWNVIWPGTPIIEVSDISTIKTEIQISEEYENMLQIWDTINIQTQNNTQIFTGTLVNILPQRDIITKRLTLEIHIPNTDEKILPKTTLHIGIKKEETQKSLTGSFIPNNAIIEKYMIPWVYVIEDGKAVFKKITLLSQNDLYSQVEWIAPWEKIITTWKENIYDGEILIFPTSNK